MSASKLRALMILVLISFTTQVVTSSSIKKRDHFINPCSPEQALTEGCRQIFLNTEQDMNDYNSDEFQQIDNVKKTINEFLQLQQMEDKRNKVNNEDCTCQNDTNFIVDYAFPRHVKNVTCGNDNKCKEGSICQPVYYNVNVLRKLYYEYKTEDDMQAIIPKGWKSEQIRIVAGCICTHHRFNNYKKIN